MINGQMLTLCYQFKSIFLHIDEKPFYHGFFTVLFSEKQGNFLLDGLRNDLVQDISFASTVQFEPDIVEPNEQPVEEWLKIDGQGAGITNWSGRGEMFGGEIEVDSSLRKVCTVSIKLAVHVGHLG